MPSPFSRIRLLFNSLAFNPLARVRRAFRSFQTSSQHYRDMTSSSPGEQNARLPSPYSQTRRSDHVDTYQSKNGEGEVLNPYTWFEEEAEERSGGLDEQGDSELMQISAEDFKHHTKIKANITTDWDFSRFSYPRLGKDGRWYWNYKSGLQAQDVLFRSKTLGLPKFDVDGAKRPEAQGEVFFDPNLLVDDGSAYMTTSSFSKDGKYFAYGISLSGSNSLTIYVRESSKPFNKCPEGGFLNDPDRLPEIIRFVKFSNIVWTHGSKGFFYQRFPERAEHGSAGEDKAGATETSDENAAIYYHVLGTDQSQDILVYKDNQNPSWFFGIGISEPEGQFVELYITKDTSHKNKLYIAELGAGGDITSKLGNLKWHKIVDNWDAEYSVISNDDRKHFAITDKDAPRRKVVTFDMPEGDPTENPEPTKLEEFIPEDKHGGFLSSVFPVNGGSFVAQYSRNACNELYAVSSTGHFTPLSDPSEVWRISAAPRQDDIFSATPPGSNNTNVTKQFQFQEKAPRPQNASGSGSNGPGDPGTMKAEAPLVDSDPESDLGALVSSISPGAVSIDGHFGDVFEGTHKTLGKVALKRPRVSGTGYNEDIIRRFEREAATWRRLRHRHILEFLGTMKRDGHMYMVSHFMDNGTLMQYLAREPKVDKVRLLCQTADAINYLHNEAVVHGDIKAGNILMSKQGFALLCDFGLTKMMDARTSVGMKGAGSMRWMSPELWDNASRSFESDVYAFGMTIAEVLSGKEPFPHLSSPMAVMLAVMRDNKRPSRQPLSSLDGLSYRGAWDIAEACWQLEPFDRIPMVEAFDRLSRELQ